MYFRRKENIIQISTTHELNEIKQPSVYRLFERYRKKTIVPNNYVETEEIAKAVIQLK